ncbi:MAG: TetR/AcrR family transcriptional regulator [Candidatus Cloacimonetes bacterium]|nr:TetR/AcrR family transcriptional regulator [Candidatus Cloacimonadota bacterium]
MTRIKTADRKIQIVAKATEIIALGGVSALTTKELSQQLNVKEMILYRCFKKKEDIILSCIESAREKQLAKWSDLIKSTKDSKCALQIITKNFTCTPSDKSSEFMLLQKLVVQNNSSQIQHQLSITFEKFAELLEQLLSDFQSNAQSLSWALVHWGLGLGIMQLLPISYLASNGFQKNQMELLFELIGIKEDQS